MPDAPITIFISYAHTDSPFVDRLEADLRQQGFDIWVDRRGLQGGQKWHRELQAAVDRSQVLLVVLSPDAVASEYVQIEYGYASNEGKVVIPLYYRACKVPMELQAIQWIDFRHTYEPGIGALLQALHRQQEQVTSTAASAPSAIAPGVPPSQQENVGTQFIALSEPESERPWNVFFARNPFFTGRVHLLARLHAQLSRSHSAAHTQAYALSGLGGIGKTQTAIEYAYRYSEEYSAVFWVRADSREMLAADYVAIARLLGIPGHEAPEQMQIVAVVKRWLEQHAGWLLILDNADDLLLLTDFLPSEGKGHVVLTTRAQATGKIAQSLSVEKLERSEGMQLLLRRAKLLAPEEPLDNASAAVRKAGQQLVSELDGLPLALDQAGAYMEDTGCSLPEYLELYRRHHLALLQQQSSMATDYPHTVASTWALSFQQVEQANPAAADLLRLCAFLHPDAIPEAIVTEGATELGPLLSPTAAVPLLLNAAIQLLRRYSLIKRDPEAKLLNIHRMVQVVLKESLDSATQGQWAERAVRAVNAAFPHEEFASWERCELYLPHALLCGELIDQYSFTFPEAARLLHAAGVYLYSHHQHVQAEPLLEQALFLRQHMLGPEHPDTATTLTRLAALYAHSGNYQQAELLVQPALATYEHILGPAEQQVAYALYVLASVYLYTGRYAQAEPLYRQALAIREHALGPTHPDVAETLNSLAVLYDYQGNYARAEPLYQRALVLSEQALGPEHPATLTMLQNLAALSYKQGKYARAELLCQQALTLRERVLGSENSETLHSLMHLGRLFTLQGQYEHAASLLQRAHALFERVLGPNNDWTLRALLFLADLAQAQHHDAQAESLYQQALTSFERMLGSEHPRVAETLTGLAHLYTQQGQYQQAEPLLERALAIDEHALGPELPQTATILDAQGHLALLQGREEQAEPLLQRALAIQEKMLGNAHPDVARTLYHLAQLYEKQGKQEQAQSLYQQALSIREQALGAEHPDTMATREALTRLVQILQARKQQNLTSQSRSVPPA